MAELKPLILFGAKGGGSAIIEAELTLLERDFDMRYQAWDNLTDPDSDLASINPMREIPALVLPNGEILTESAAITLWLCTKPAQVSLMPDMESALFPPFLRWLIWLVSSVYPTFSYGDHPERLLDDPAAANALRAATDARRQFLWQSFETALSSGPWCLGEAMTALDLYVSVMTRWRPRRAWFSTHCPKLFRVASAVDALPELATVWARNFGDPEGL